jgi:hypothetical protein
MQQPLPHLLFLSLITLPVLHIDLAFGAYSLPVSWDNNYVEQNSAHTWCYFPAAGQTLALSCAGDFDAVLAVHISQTVSIGYYAADNTRLGGPEWSVQTTAGKVNLCLSGQAGDGTYQTMCTGVVADNTLGAGAYCQVAKAQDKVTDGCYTPAALAALPTSTSVLSTPIQTTSPVTSELSPLPPLSATPITTPTTPTTLTSPSTSGNSSGNNVTKLLETIIPLIVAILALITALIEWRRHRRRRAAAMP